jgi:hypothetical protein
VHCLGKYANNAVHGVIPSNAKMVNKRGKSYLEATKTIAPGSEIFWIYRSNTMWQTIEKLTPTILAQKKDDILFRDNTTENERILNALEPYTK